MNPTWTILIATLPQRVARFERLINVLLPQTEPYDGEVRVCALWNRGERPLCEVRQTLVDYAVSNYVSFIDDDDLVPDYHVEEVMNVLPNDRDYVGWRMQCYVDNVALKPTFHSLRYRGWCNDKHGYYRDVSHLNPIKTKIAQRVDFCRGTAPEDVSWADQVRVLVTTESYVEHCMYLYHSTSNDSTWNGDRIDRTDTRRLEIKHPHFSYHLESSHL